MASNFSNFPIQSTFSKLRTITGSVTSEGRNNQPMQAIGVD